MGDVKEQLDHLAETLELADEQLDEMRAVQERRASRAAEWWIAKRQQVQRLVGQARLELADLLLLCDDRGDDRADATEVQNSAPTEGDLHA